MLSTTTDKNIANIAIAPAAAVVVNGMPTQPNNMINTNNNPMNPNIINNNINNMNNIQKALDLAKKPPTNKAPDVPGVSSIVVNHQTVLTNPNPNPIPNVAVSAVPQVVPVPAISSNSVIDQAKSKKTSRKTISKSSGDKSDPNGTGVIVKKTITCFAIKHQRIVVARLAEMMGPEMTAGVLESRYEKLSEELYQDIINSPLDYNFKHLFSVIEAKKIIKSEIRRLKKESLGVEGLFPASTSSQQPTMKALKVMIIKELDLDENLLIPAVIETASEYLNLKGQVDMCSNLREKAEMILKAMGKLPAK